MRKVAEFENYIFNFENKKQNDIDNQNFNFVVLQKPLAVGKENEIEEFIIRHSAKILEKKKVLIDARQISNHYKQFFEKDFFVPLIRYYLGKTVYVWLVSGTQDILESMRSDIGPAKISPDSFREKLVGEEHLNALKQFGVLDNGIHISDSKEEGAREANIWFGVPSLVLKYENEEINKLTKTIHNFIWRKLRSIPWANAQYVNTNNETAVRFKNVDLDYRLLVPEDRIDEAVKLIEKLIPGSFYDRTGTDSATGATYKKLEYVFEHGKADIAVVPTDSYSQRMGSAYIVDLLPENEKASMLDRKEKAFLQGKEEYLKVKDQIRQEIKDKYKL